MKNAILLHGTCSKEEYYSDEFPSLSNSHWFPWLQKQLLIKGVSAQTPEIPEAYEPVYDIWKKEIERFDINENTILVGHSCGGGFFTRWLSENNIKVDKLVLVAPWLDPEKTKQEKTFFDYNIDLENKANEIHILCSTNDDQDVLDSVKTLKEAVPSHKYHEFKDYGHFCYGDLGTDAFPELLEICTGEGR